MNPHDPLLKAALLIHRQLSRSRHATPSSLARTVAGLLEDQETLQRAWRQLARAEQRGWHLAADHHAAGVVGQRPHPHQEPHPQHPGSEAD